MAKRTIPLFRYSFAPGFDKLTVEDGRKVKSRLYEALGCKSKWSFSRYKCKFNNIPHHVYMLVTEIFAEFGVPEQDVWEITDVQDDEP